ncbi:MAG: transcription elongation factor GreA [Clostridia bacterium]|nr:transcription elongation factor GreA [Clostridia bacterium]
MAKMYYTESGALAEIDSEKVYMSREGYEEAKAYLKYLQTEKRDEIVARIAEARSHGDLSENAEYDAARNEQASNEGEIFELEYKLKNSAIYGMPPTDVDFVTFGVRVTVYDEEWDEEEEYEITGSKDANIEENKISNESPMGMSLFGHKVGDRAIIHLPNGMETVLIVKKIELA